MAYPRNPKLEQIIIFCFLVMCLFSFCSAGKNRDAYICTGPTAYAYHKTNNCKGLRRCTGEIKKISIKQAKKENRKACKLCFKKR